MKYYIKKEDAERYRNMSKEQKEKILNQIEDLEESYKKQWESIQKLKVFFSGKAEVRK
tara:strand:+ start:664 stop:837 length:174 start_codon:yes stop_codon:yes gene_type:complete